jgi:hypothetical protein
VRALRGRWHRVTYHWHGTITSFCLIYHYHTVHESLRIKRASSRGSGQRKYYYISLIYSSARLLISQFLLKPLVSILVRHTPLLLSQGTTRQGKLKLGFFSSLRSHPCPLVTDQKKKATPQSYRTSSCCACVASSRITPPYMIEGQAHQPKKKPFTPSCAFTCARYNK